MTATNQPISASAPSAIIAVTTSASTALLLPFKASTIRVVNKGTGYIYIAIALTAAAAVATVATTTFTNTSTGVLAGSDVAFTLDPTQPYYISIIGDAASTAHVHIGDGT